MHKDLQYAIDKDWFGAPKDCVPKSALRQILDAAKKTKCQTPGAFFTICISTIPFDDTLAVPSIP